MANRYSDIVTIRESRPAYNIREEGPGDWKSFIANDQFNELLKKVVSSIFNNQADNHKSIWISGTYGSGKSHAGAVLEHLLCDAPEEIEDYIEQEYSAPKYGVLRSNIQELRKHKRLFPVNMYGQQNIAHEDDLSLQIQREVTRALKDAGISVNVQTDFDNYVSHIETMPGIWENLIANNAQLASVAPDINKLKLELKSGDTEVLGRVKDALRESGIDIRLDLENLGQWIFEVQNELCKQGVYDGLLIIWDEFTELMTSAIGVRLLVKLQEISEAMMKPENDSYFLFISHPSALNSLKEEEREKTKGRYHYVTYNMEPVSAFKIMSRKFKVIDELAYKRLAQSFYSGREELLDVYSQDSTKPEETIQDIQNLFPLHPSTANLATYYAREAGSSSRSVFEFLANSSVRDFLDTEEHFASGDTITADYLWDYVVGAFNEDSVRFGAVTERFNSYRLQVEHEGAQYFAVFKGILLLNALNNIAHNTTVTPSEENIHNLFQGTAIDASVDDILDFFNDKSIIQRAPGGLYSIVFSALPSDEIAKVKEELVTSSFRFTDQVIKFGTTANIELDKFLAQAKRPYKFQFYSLQYNEFTLTNQIEQGLKKAQSHEVFMALMVGKTIEEIHALNDIAEKLNKDKRFENMAFIVFDTPLGINNYERFIEYMSNAKCSQKYAHTSQQKTNEENASKLLKEWIAKIRSGNFSYYIKGAKDTTSTYKLTSVVNANIAPIIFSSGPESLLNMQKTIKTFWEKKSAKATVDAVLSFNTKKDVLEHCTGAAKPVEILFQDSVDDNLELKQDIDKEHPLYKVCEFVKNSFAHTNKDTQFNLGDKLSVLAQAPYGLYPSYACMAMVSFAMRRYIKQLFDMNGKPLVAQHLVDAVVNMFKAWDTENTNNSLNVRFESKEAGELSKLLIKNFKLNELPGYSDISSLTDARWAIVNEYSKQKNAPLWSLKYAEDSTKDISALIDNILKVCSPSQEVSRNPQLMSATVNGLKTLKFDFGNLVNDADNFEDGFNRFVQSVEFVNVKEEELAEARTYLDQHLQSEVGLWTESEVENQLKNWRISKQPKPVEPTPPVVPVYPTDPIIPENPDQVHDDTDLQILREDVARKISRLNEGQMREVLNRISKDCDKRVLDLINCYV